jgi:putative Holliday junction resolvase
MDGTLGRQAEKVKEFTQKLCEHTEIPVEYRDERLTTVMAERLKQASGGKKTRGKARSDAQAAALILQSYLDEGRESELA